MKIITNILIAVFVLIFNFSKAQTFTGSTGIIHDVNTEYFTAFVSGLVPSTIDSTFGIEQICLDVNHTYDSDLDFTLIAPDGTQIQLISSLGGGGHNFTGTCLNSNSTSSILAQSAPFTGTFSPMSNLSFANNGQNGNGVWQLRVIDIAAGDSGLLNSWSITFGNQPAPLFHFMSSNLPIVVINTNGVSIVDSPKILAHFGIIDNGYGNINHITDPFNHFNGYCGIEFRGSSSQMFPKKSYSVEMWDSLGNQIDTAIMGMPSENDWILNANYTDKTLMHNVLSYHLSQQMGHYATRYKFCEVVVDGEYKGVYDFSEKIKKDANRVNISTLALTDTAGVELTGGYIFKIDKTTGSGGGGWYSNYAPAANPNGQQIFFQYDYPKDVDIQPTQAAYIQAYVDSFETALNGPNFADPNIGYRKYINVNSFIDYFFVNELSRNVDGYRLSTFLYKEKITHGNKISIGPVWDYDITYGNADYCNGNLDTGWAYQFGNYCNTDGYQIPFWWNRLLQDSNFVNQLKCRWDTVRQNIITTTSINQFADSLKQLLTQAQARNFTVWPILGIYIWPEPAPYDTSHAQAVQRMEDWIANRITWLDANMPGHCYPPVLTGVNNSANNEIKVYPIPADDKLYFNSIKENSNYLIFGIDGTLVYQGSLNKEQRSIDTKQIAAGMYFLKFDNSKYAPVKIVINH